MLYFCTLVPVSSCAAKDLFLARIHDYREAFRLACRELATVNLHRICSLSGAVCITDKNGNLAISIPFMNQEHLINFEPEIEVILKGKGEPVPLLEKILILHYLLKARGESLWQQLITFRQVEEGPFYYSAFMRRALEPLAQNFGADPQALVDCGCELGAVPDELGDASITLKPLPRVPVTFVIWGGDDELPPQANILFDESIVSYLPTEDIAVLSSIIVYRLIRIKQRLGSIKPG